MGDMKANASGNNTDIEEVMFEEVPDLSLPPDAVGPWDQEPNDDEAENPQPAIDGWQNASNDDLESSWWPARRSSFCAAHHVGYFCNGHTRVRCCRDHGWYVQCGTSSRSRSCGGGGHDWFHPWRPSGGYNSWCSHHSVGSFCSHHTRISCCRSNGWIRECSSRSSTHSYC